MSNLTSSTGAALRLGWSLAEVRGRNWFAGPRPTSTPLPEVPAGALPLRSQRSTEAARYEAVQALLALAREVGFAGADEFTDGLQRVLPAFDDAGARMLVDPRAPDAAVTWEAISAFFFDWDARVQDELTRRDDVLANAYLLGRGLAESYWSLGPDDAWSADGIATAMSPAFLLGIDRRRELTRMLGRLGPHLGNEMTAAAVAGSIEAWGAVVADARWTAAPLLRDSLYEQVRRWYQLLVLQQDPTTLLRPYTQLALSRTFGRTVRAFWPQVLLALVALGLITAFFALTNGSAPHWLISLLATGGVGTFAAAGVITRAKNAAQQLAVRLRQDAYTDLVAVDITVVPPYPGARTAGTLRRAESTVEKAVRRRLVTPPTPGPNQ